MGAYAGRCDMGCNGPFALRGQVLEAEMCGADAREMETVMEAKTGDAATTNTPLTAEQAAEALSGDAGDGAEIPETTDEAATGDEGSGAGDEPTQDDEATVEPDADDGDESAEDQGDKKPSRGDARFAKLTADLHLKDEALAAKDSELATLKQQVASVETAAVAGLALPTSYLSNEEAQLIRGANEAMAREQFLLENIATGATDPQSGKELTPQEIGRELAGLRGQAGRNARAQMLYEDRKAQFIADAKAGREAREAKAKAPVKPVGTKVAPAPVKPRVAVAAPTVAASKPVAAGAKKPGMSTKRFEEAKQQFGEREAAVMALAEM